MKKFISFLALGLFVIGALVPLPSIADTAAVTGKVQLSAKSSGFPSNLEDIFIGHDDALTLGKKGKTVNVTATYVGETKLRVSELGDFTDAEKKYLFDIPIPTVMQTFTNKAQKATKKSGVIQAIFASASELAGDDDNSGSSGDSFGSNSLVKAFSLAPGNKKRAKSSAVSLGQAISVGKIVAIRKGNKGTLKGTFASEGNKAKGRFALKFTFEE